MITLTPFERHIRDELVRRVMAGSDADVCLSYKQLGLAVDPEHHSTYPMTRPPFRGLNEALGHVTMYEVEHGRPMLTAIVVDEQFGVPGDGFARLARHLGRKIDETFAAETAFWKQEMAHLRSFWTSPDLSRFVDAALDRVLSEVAKIRRKLD